MARLGKREREAKRDLIRANLNAPMERTPKGMGSSVSVYRLMGNTHTLGFRDSRHKVRSEAGATHGNGSANARMGDGRPCRVAK